MDRLTVNDLNKVCYDPWELCGMDSYCTKGCHEEGGCAKGCHILKMYRKLAEYETLEEQGKLLKLPVAVGDMVYYADNEYYFTVLPVKVDEIAIMESNEILYKCLLFDGNGDVETQFDFNKDDFGKIVFLTKESAEAALKELERGKGE